MNKAVIPSETTVAVNLWSLHSDPGYWPDPDKFDPTRFLTSEGQLLPPDDTKFRHLLPNGIGTRRCPGESFAKNRLFLVIGDLVREFDLEKGCKRASYHPSKFYTGLQLIPPRFTLKMIPKRTEQPPKNNDL